MLGFLKPFQRRKSRTAGLLAASRAGVERAIEALPEAGLADMLLDLAARSGVDLGDLVERAVERAGTLAARAGESTSSLVQSQAARELAERARVRAAELAVRAGAAGLGSALAPRRRRSRLPLALGLIGGIAAGSALAYLLTTRQGAELRAKLLGQPAPVIEEETVVVVVEGSEIPVANPSAPPPTARVRSANPVQNVMETIRLRYREARNAARQTQEETARTLWREYSEDMQHRAADSG